MNRTDPIDTDTEALLAKIRALVAASDRDAEEVLDDVAELLGRRRRSQEVYQKPLG